MLKLYNTLTGKKEVFKSLEKGVVKMYNCGPTVYNYAHIGNLRAYVFTDVLRRTLEYNGYKVKQVMNITDIGHLTSDADDGDDKMIKALRREGKPFTLKAMREVADKYTAAFVDDLKALNIELPHEMPRASDHIPEDIELIKKLEEEGFVYKTSGGVYFDTAKFPDYGKLGNINLKGQLAGARVATNSEKKNPKDFTLWKFSRNDIGWESPWGKGFPGWHIECSAMSRKYLGQPFDIHTGGIDHIPIHHNNEIAQSEAAFGVPLANYWLHNEHLIIPTGKMAKLGENFVTLQTLKENGITAIAYRYWLLTAHYRTPVNFSWEVIHTSSRKSYNALIDRLTDLIEESKVSGKVIKEDMEKFSGAINDDLNTPQAIAILWKVLKDSASKASDRVATVSEMDKVFGLQLIKMGEFFASFQAKKEIIPEEIIDLQIKMDTARSRKDFKTSDFIREKIEMEGYNVTNKPGQSSIVFKKLSF